jgi:ComF family protein
MPGSVTTLASTGKSVLRGLRTALLDTIYPPRCLACPTFTDSAHGLCASCWRETYFISGAACEACGAPIPGEAERGARCDTCRRHPPAWDRGAAALLYRGAGKRMVLAFKHADRLDMAMPLARWMQAAGAGVLSEADLVVPVPLHWRRLFTRRYNQSAELARALGRLGDRPCVPDLLQKTRATPDQKSLGRVARATNQLDAVRVNPRRRDRLAGRSVLVVDDVLTTGATLSVCAEVLKGAGAAQVNILALCRVAFGESADI